MKLLKIITEILNTYQVEAEILSKKDEFITDILAQIRGLRKVTIVNNITPEDYVQNDKYDYTKVNIKFVSRDQPKKDIKQFEEDILTSDMSEKDLRIPGVVSVKFDLDTLKRV